MVVVMVMVTVTVTVNRTRQDRTGQVGQAGQDRAGQGRTGQDRAGSYRQEGQVYARIGDQAPGAHQKAGNRRILTTTTTRKRLQLREEKRREESRKNQGRIKEESGVSLAHAKEAGAVRSSVQAFKRSSVQGVYLQSHKVTKLIAMIVRQ
ncbi:hypothetical protein K504DRAFT_180870 [Pleomassaria siparia CBS 279.74]|uniref:Uncharacterized protein n=1 Tax=Pleomassaria siparia CBS 279.74 TaxID=1314801 RepID=A0A6G1JRI3_9PLEO|nr:hypothetical protein K504DRAFT_180870 [Pleomassaria siparia CBS 279.74]